jgi:hypothetical protein
MAGLGVAEPQRLGGGLALFFFFGERFFESLGMKKSLVVYMIGFPSNETKKIKMMEGLFYQVETLGGGGWICHFLNI